MERLVQLIVLIGVSIFVYKTIRKFLGKVGGNLFKSFFIGSGEKYSICPKCNERNGIDDIVNTKTISSKHEHERVNGKKDERYKKNDLVDKTEYTYKCKKCGNEFKSVKDEKRGSTDSILGGFVGLGNSITEYNKTISDFEKKYGRKPSAGRFDGSEYLLSHEEIFERQILKNEEEREKNYKLTGFKETDSERRTREHDENQLKKCQNKYGEEIGKRLFKQELWVGMSSEMVIDSKGKPKEVIEKVSRGKKREEYFYDGYKNRQGNMSYKFRVVLINGKVDGWNDITN